MCAGLLLSRPLCVCMCVFRGGGKWVLELLFHFNCTHPPPNPIDASLHTIFFSSLSSSIFFAPAASLPELFPLPSNSFSAVACLSPLSLFLSYLGFPTLYLCGW